MPYYKRIVVIAPFISRVTKTCAPLQQPQPDPLNDIQLTLPQKQLLELEQIPYETKSKLDETQANIKTLVTKVAPLADVRMYVLHRDPDYHERSGRKD